MNAEILTIGDEIITGHTLDTNGAYLGAELVALGIAPVWRTSVGDHATHIEDAIRVALRRADLVIATGGLGPTDDDITKKSIVKVFSRRLALRDDILKDIEARYAARGIAMPTINHNQALLPDDSTYLKNRLGSAVGILIEEAGKMFVALPGVPSEMRAIFAEELAPILRGRTHGAIAVIKLRTSGIVESALAEKITGAPLGHKIRLAYLPHYSGVDLRIIAKAENQALANDLADELAQWLRLRVGSLMYGEGEDTLESVVGELLRARGEKLTVVESCTGGLLAGRITAVSGSSDYFEQGFITYANEAKTALVGVNPETLKSHGAVSAETACEMAQGAKERAGAQWALSITGIAGPAGGTKEKPVGLVYIGLAGEKDGAEFVTAHKYQFGADRTVNRERAVATALNLLRLGMAGA